MTQFIVGIGNEIAVTAFLFGAIAAIVVPWYLLRPSRDSATWTAANRNSRRQSSTSTTSSSSAQSNSFTTMDDGSTADLRRRNTGGGGDGDETPRGSNSPPSSNYQTHNDSMNFTVRVKYHESDRQFPVTNTTTVEQLKRLAFPDEFSQGKRIRLIFCGRILHEDSSTLEHFHIGANSILHCQISEMQNSNPENGQPYQDQGPDLDLGHVLIPTVALGLLMVWFCVFTYSELFTSTSVTVLAVLTILFGMFVFLT